MRRNTPGSGRKRRLWLAVAGVSAVLIVLLQAPSSVYAVTNPIRPPASHSAAPVKLPPTSGEPAPKQPKKLSVGEQPNLRTRFSSTRFNADHTFTTTTSVHPVNYRVANGGWQPVDNNLGTSRQKGYAYQNGANGFQAQFKGQLGDDYLRWVVDGQPVSMTLQGASHAPATTKGSSIQYPGALAHVNASYNVVGDGLEEVLELQDASAPSSFQFLLRTPKGTTTSQQADGSWAFALPGRAPASFWLKAPFAYDSGAKTIDPTQSHAQIGVKDVSGGFQVSLSVDTTWLHDPSRVFPVFVDPTLTIQPDTLDTTFEANCANCTGFVASSGSGAGRMFIGTDATFAYREALQFDLSSIPAGVSVTSASLGVFYDQACIAVSGNKLCGGNNHQIDVHQMTAPWSTSSTTSQVQFSSTVLSSFQLGATAPQEWMTWDVSAAASGWVSGAQPNYGLYLMLPVESKNLSGPAPPGDTFQVPQLAPQLTVTYSGDSVALAQPSTLHANGAELSWSQYTGPSGAKFQQYQVHRSLTSGFTPSAATMLTSTNDLTATTFRDATAAPGGTFYYAVVANSSKSNEVKVTLPADGQSSVSLRPGPGQDQATFMYLYDKGVNCANYGADQLLQAGADGTGVYRSLLRFGLPQIPSGTTNLSAKLNLVHFLENNVNLTLHAYPVTSTWDEGTGTRSPATCTGDGVTWYERTGGVQWATPGGDFDSSTASSQVSIPANETENVDSFDVSSIVSKWVSGQAPNLGFLIKSDSETRGTLNFAVFASNDYSPAPGVRPQLTLTYTDGSHASLPSVSVSAPAPGATVSGSTATLSAAASGANPIRQVQFFVDGTAVGTASQAPWQVMWNSASVGNGSHTITTTATDSAGNSATSAGAAVTVNNYQAPTTSINPLPINGSGLTGTVAVSTSNTVASGLSINKVELYLDGALSATSTSSPWSLSWNTLDPNLPAFDGSHTLVTKITDSSGLIASSPPVTVTVANTAGSQDQAAFNPTASVVPQAMSFDPNATTQLGYPVNVSVTNASTLTWSGVTLRYRWYLAGSSTSFGDSGDVASLALAPGASQTTQVNVTPPTLPAGMDAARFTLRFDLVDSSGTSPAFFADKGNQPLDNPVIVNKVLSVNLGLEHFWQFSSQPAGAGITQMTNIANGNSVLSLIPLSEPGRGLSTVVDLTYNSLEEHSDSPAGNNWSLSITSLTRFGDPLDVHPNNADSIAGRSNKFINLVDGTGRLLTFTGVTNSDGTTSWFEPAGVHLYLRQVSSDTSLQGRFWAITRPDRSTFFYDSQGFPTAVSDKNGNTLTFTLTAVQPGDDPGGPKYHVTQVTDAAGQGSNPAPNRIFNITYFTKATARKPQIRGKIASITDHLFDSTKPGQGRELDFAYYDDGNLLSITDKGGHNADGSPLADRSMVFTYTTSDGSGPAISDPNARVNPDPKTPNESTKVFSIRDYNGHETTFAYNGPGSSIDRWKLASITDRAQNTTNFSYDDVNQVTTVAQPTPSGQTARTYKYTYDVQGRPTVITDPLGGTTQFQWSADNAVTQLTEPNMATRKFSYDDNGYPTSVINEVGDQTKLTYQAVAVDSTDVASHWNPAGGANGTGRTIPHISQLQTKQDPNAVHNGTADQWTFQYDNNGNLRFVKEPLDINNDQATATNDFNPDGTVADTIDFIGNKTTYLSYDANGLPTEIADATDSATNPAHPLQIAYDAAGKTLFIQDENHGSSSFPFNPTQPQPTYQTVFYYDSFGRLGRQTTPKSTLLALGALVESDTQYDPDDNVLSQVAPHCVRLSDCVNETASAGAGTGDTTTAEYDALDRQVLITDPSNNKTASSYDVAGRLQQVTLPLGVANGTPNNTHTVNYQYDALDRTTVQTENHVNSDGSVSAVNTLACYDAVNNLVSVTAPNAGLNSITCPGTTSTPFTTIYSYDLAHNLLSTTDPLTQSDNAHHITSSTYDFNGNRITTTDANNNTTSYQYDTLNRATQATQPFSSGHPIVSKTVYDADGNVVQAFSPRAVDCQTVGTAKCAQPSSGPAYVATNHYDQLNRLVQQDLPVDATSTASNTYHVYSAYDFNGNLLSTSLPTNVTDPTQVPAGAKTVSIYFDTGWIASQQVGNDTAIHYDYQGTGKQTCRRPALACSTQDLTNEVLWQYQPNGLLAQRSDQQQQPVSYQYDPDGNLTKSQDASGLTDPSQTEIDTQSTYDDLDRLVRTDLKSKSASVPNWTFSSFTYDLNGNVIDLDQTGQESSPGGTVVKDGEKIHSDFDQANWLVDQVNSTLSQEVKNSFTPVGLEQRREVDKISGSTLAPLQTTNWQYFPNGKLSSLTTTAPCSGQTQTIESHTVSYLDPAGIYVDGNRTQDQYSTRLGGAQSCSSAQTSTGAATYTFDAQDRLVQNLDGHGDTTTYALDGPGNTTSQVTKDQSGTVTSSTTNIYDSNNLNQLKTSTSGGQQLNYFYDEFGRQQCVTVSTGTQADCGPSDNATSFPNLVSDNKYDYLDRLQTYRAFSNSARTDKATYTYDALNRQVQETEQHPSFNGDTRITAFSYLGMGNQEVEETATSKNTGQIQSVKDFTYDVNGHRLAETDNEYKSGQPGTPTTYTYGYDTHGSTSQLVDSSGNTKASYGYTPQGQGDTTLTKGESSDPTTPTNPFRFSGNRLDTGSGTLSMGVRRFGPDVGHFLTPDFFYDSLANLSLSTDPLTGNRYDLAGGNPISFKEWDGHEFVADGGGGASTTPTVDVKKTAQPISGDGGSGQSSSCNFFSRNLMGGCGNAKDPHGCNTPIIGFFICRPQPIPAPKDGQAGQPSPPKRPLCLGLAEAGVGLGETLCNAGVGTIDLPRPQPKAGNPADLGKAALLAAAAAAAAAAGVVAGALAAQKSSSQRGPIIVDNGVLVYADKGSASALALIRGGTTYAPPSVIAEFLNVSDPVQEVQRIAFLESEGIQVLDQPMNPNVYNAVQPRLGVTDAEVAALASGTGYTAYTTDNKLVNVIQQTLFLKNVPIQYFPQ